MLILLFLFFSCSTYDLKSLSKIELLIVDNPKCTYLGQIFANNEDMNSVYGNLKTQVLSKGGDSFYIVGSKKTKKTSYVTRPSSYSYTPTGQSIYSPGESYFVTTTLHQYEAKAYRCKYASL